VRRLGIAVGVTLALVGHEQARAAESMEDVVRAWEQEQGAKIEASARTKILEDVARAIQRATGSGQFSAERVSRASGTALRRYLDGLLGSTDVAEYLPLLVEVMDPGGVFPRWPTPYPMVSVATARQAVAVVINGLRSELPSYRSPLRILVPTGNVSVELYGSDGRLVCRLRFTAEEGKSYSESCGS